MPPAAGPAATPVTADPSAPRARQIPDQLPDIPLPAPDGVLHRLSEYHGKLLLVNFWATWCEPCRREIPVLQALRRERAGNGVEVVGIALDHRADVVKYASDRHMTYPLLVGEKGGLEVVSALGMDTVLPFSVFADRTGRIVTLKIGELHADEARLILDRMGDLDAGRIGLAGGPGADRSRNQPPECRPRRDDGGLAQLDPFKPDSGHSAPEAAQCPRIAVHSRRVACCTTV